MGLTFLDFLLDQLVTNFKRQNAVSWNEKLRSGPRRERQNAGCLCRPFIDRVSRKLIFRLFLNLHCLLKANRHTRTLRNVSVTSARWHTIWLDFRKQGPKLISSDFVYVKILSMHNTAVLHWQTCATDEPVKNGQRYDPNVNADQVSRSSYPGYSPDKWSTITGALYANIQITTKRPHILSHCTRTLLPRAIWRNWIIAQGWSNESPNRIWRLIGNAAEF